MQLLLVCRAAAHDRVSSREASRVAQSALAAMRGHAHARLQAAGAAGAGQGAAGVPPGLAPLYEALEHSLRSIGVMC